MGIVDELGGTRIYLDTNVFIYALEEHPDYVDALAELFDEVDSGRLTAVTSELTLAEALVKPMTQRDRALQEAYERAVQPGDSLEVVLVSRSVLIQAARLRATTSLKLPDAIHVATAQIARCDTLLTNDQRLKAAPGLHVLLFSEALRA